MDKEGWKRKLVDMIWALHGAVGMADDWKHFSAQMAEQGHLTRRVDLWRFLACCPMSLREFGKALNEEVRRVDKAPILLGYSMGARLALHALLEDARQSAESGERALWQGAILVAPHTGLREDQKLARQVQDAEWAALALQGDWETFLERWNAQAILQPSGSKHSDHSNDFDSTGENNRGGNVPEEGSIPWADRRSLKPRRQAVARSFMDWSSGVQDDLRSELHYIQAKLLWMTGEEDKKFSNIAQQALELLPSAQHVTIPACGHRVPWEQPERFRQEVSQWLSNNHFRG